MMKIRKEKVERRNDMDSQLEIALNRKDVRQALRNYKGNPQNFKDGLRYELEQVNYEFSRLKKFATTLDYANKASVPIDSALDYFNIVGGVGYAAKGIKDLAVAPGYLAYDAYYTAKTGDAIGGLLINPAYEVLSWASLGGLPHILSHYSKQVNKRTIVEASNRFLNKLNSKSLDDRLGDAPKIIKFPTQRRKGIAA